MTPRIFLNYRRDDEPGYAQALYGRLEAAFGADAVFMDVEGYIRPGDDFAGVIDRAVGDCAAMLVVIGPKWAEIMRDRAAEPADFVKIEITSALVRDKLAIPVLVGGARLPGAGDAPDALAPLFTRNAAVLNPSSFSSDCDRLIQALADRMEEMEVEHDPFLYDPPGVASPPPPPEMRAAIAPRPLPERQPPAPDRLEPFIGLHLLLLLAGGAASFGLTLFLKDADAIGPEWHLWGPAATNTVASLILGAFGLAALITLWRGPAAGALPRLGVIAGWIAAFVFYLSVR